jgi:hypothetical protein
MSNHYCSSRMWIGRLSRARTSSTIIEEIRCSSGQKNTQGFIELRGLRWMASTLQWRKVPMPRGLPSPRSSVFSPRLNPEQKLRLVTRAKDFLPLQEARPPGIPSRCRPTRRPTPQPCSASRPTSSMPTPCFWSAWTRPASSSAHSRTSLRLSL